MTQSEMTSAPVVEPLFAEDEVGSTPRSASRRWWLRLIPFGCLIAVAIIGPWIAPFDPIEIVGRPSQPPGGEFVFGTDNSGRDVLSRTLASTRIDIVIAVAVSILATCTGILLGLVIGMNESKKSILGFFSRFCARGLDLFEAIPSVIVAMVVLAVAGNNRFSLVFVLAIVLTPIQTRLVRTEALRVRKDAYLDAARQAGQSEFQLVLRHALPNSAFPALENMSAVFGVAILLTSALGFLGVGLEIPTPEWGSMISGGMGDIARGRPWAVLLPAFALCATVVIVSWTGRQVSKRFRLGASTRRN